MNKKSVLRSCCTLLFIISSVLIIDCSGSEEDKYDLLTKSDRKTISEFCTCMEPFNDILDRMISEADSLKGSQYADSMSIKYEEFSLCAEKIKPIEKKGDDQRYIDQLFAYMKKKYPNCSQFILGTRGEHKENK